MSGILKSSIRESKRRILWEERHFMSGFAYLQGDLDYLCGVYTIVNAAKLVHKELRGEKAYHLFNKCLKHIERSKRLSKVLIEGLSAADLKALLREILARHYGIKVGKPFHKVSGINLSQFLIEIRRFMEEGRGRAVIVCFADGWQTAHWSVIKTISKKQISFLDSAECKRISWEKCTIRIATANKPYLFETQETYFLSNTR